MNKPTLTKLVQRALASRAVAEVRTVEKAHTGAMVALYPSMDDAETLATAMGNVEWPQGATITEPNEYHITLAYLGESAEIDESRRAALSETAEQLVTLELPPLTFNGVARFNGSDEDGDAIVILFSEPMVNDLATVARRDMGDASKHSFLAHMTLAYIPKDAPTPTVPPPFEALKMDRMALVLADVTFAEFKLTNASSNAVALKANFGARAGQVIAGNLARGAGGKFTAAGSAGAGASSASTANTGRAQKRTAALVASGVSSDDAAALETFAKGGTLSAAQQQSLEKAGLVRTGDDGAARLAPNARGFLRALRKGDARAAADAAGAARDAGNRRTEAAARKAEAARKRAEREAKRNQPKPAKGRAPKQPKPDRTPEQLQKIGNRVEEVDAQIDDAVTNERTLNNAQLTKAFNRLEELETQLGKLGDGDAQRAAHAAIEAARERLEAMRDGKPDPKAAREPIPLDGDRRIAIATREATQDAAIEVFKDASGAPRWLLISSNAYQDKEGEIVSQAALEADVARWWDRREKGITRRDPLRWWHVGSVLTEKAKGWQDVEAGEGMDIGQCDFRMLHGRMLVESGTFDTPELAEAFAPHMKALRVSLGFATPIWQPVEGVYQDIHSFERSLLPMAKEANALTGGIILKGEKTMTKIQDKVKAFASIAGDGAANTLAGFLNAAETVDKQAEGAGLKHKEGETAQPEGTVEGETLTPAAIESKAEGDTAEGEMPAEEVTEEGDEDPALMVGDMTPQELAGALAEPLAQAMAAALAPMMKAFEDQSAVVKGLSEKLESVSKEAKAAQAKVKELEGDAPTGYRASQDTETVSKEDSIDQQTVDELTAIAAQFLAARKK